MRTPRQMTIWTRDPSNDASFFKSFQPTLSNAQHMSLGREFKSQHFHNLDALTLSVRPADLLLSCHVTNLLLTLWTSMSSLVLSISSWIKTDYRVINAYKYCLLLKILRDHLLVIYGSSSKQFSQHLAPHSSVYESLLQYSRFERALYVVCLQWD